jgi:myosin protein heavy chain
MYLLDPRLTNLQLESQLENLEQTRTTEARSVRTVDRTVKDLQGQIERRDKSIQNLQDDLNKSRDKTERLLQTIEELQTSDSSAQLSAKRAERELREEREKALRLERELEAARNSRNEHGSARQSGALAALSDAGSRRGSYAARPVSQNGDVKIEVPQRTSSLTKGFL